MAANYVLADLQHSVKKGISQADQSIMCYSEQAKSAILGTMCIKQWYMQLQKNASSLKC